LGFALALVTVAGCSSKPKPTLEQQTQADMAEYEAQIRKVVSDPARANELVALANAFQGLAHEGIANAKEYRAKVAALDANYGATRADYEILFSQQDTAREALLKKATALRERAAALMTDSEWTQLKKARLRALDAELQELIS
jgi:hypothetical protein